MTWGKFESEFYRHPKIKRVGVKARWLYVVSICRALERKTDGYMTTEDADEVLHLANCKEAQMRGLVREALWDQVEDGYRIHDYLDYQPASSSRKGSNGRSRADEPSDGEVLGGLRPQLSPTLGLGQRDN